LKTTIQGSGVYKAGVSSAKLSEHSHGYEALVRIQSVKRSQVQHPDFRWHIYISGCGGQRKQPIDSQRSRVEVLTCELMYSVYSFKGISRFTGLALQQVKPGGTQIYVTAHCCYASHALQVSCRLQLCADGGAGLRVERGERPSYALPRQPKDCSVEEESVNAGKIAVRNGMMMPMVEPLLRRCRPTKQNGGSHQSHRNSRLDCVMLLQTQVSDQKKRPLHRLKPRQIKVDKGLPSSADANQVGHLERFSEQQCPCEFIRS
jgi:hypothetical protein